MEAGRQRGSLSRQEGIEIDRDSLIIPAGVRAKFQDLYVVVDGQASTLKLLRRELDTKAEHNDAVRIKEHVDSVYRRMRELEQHLGHKADVEEVAARLEELAAAVNSKPDEAALVEAFQRERVELERKVSLTDCQQWLEDKADLSVLEATQKRVTQLETDQRKQTSDLDERLRQVRHETEATQIMLGDKLEKDLSTCKRGLQEAGDHWRNDIKSESRHLEASLHQAMSDLEERISQQVSAQMDSLSAQMTHVSEQLVASMMTNSQLEQKVAALPSRQWYEDELSGRLSRVDGMALGAELQMYKEVRDREQHDLQAHLGTLETHLGTLEARLENAIKNEAENRQRGLEDTIKRSQAELEKVVKGSEISAAKAEGLLADFSTRLAALQEAVQRERVASRQVQDQATEALQMAQQACSSLELRAAAEEVLSGEIQSLRHAAETTNSKLYGEMQAETEHRRQALERLSRTIQELRDGELANEVETVASKFKETAFEIRKELSTSMDQLRKDFEGKLSFEGKLRKGMIEGHREELDEKIRAAHAKAREVEERLKTIDNMENPEDVYAKCKRMVTMEETTRKQAVEEVLTTMQNRLAVEERARTQAVSGLKVQLANYGIHEGPKGHLGAPNSNGDMPRGITEVLENRISLEEKARTNAIKRMQDTLTERFDEEERQRLQVKKELLSKLEEVEDKVDKLQQRDNDLTRLVDNVHTRLTADLREEEQHHMQAVTNLKVELEDRIQQSMNDANFRALEEKVGTFMAASDDARRHELRKLNEFKAYVERQIDGFLMPPPPYAPGLVRDIAATVDARRAEMTLRGMPAPPDRLLTSFGSALSTPLSTTWTANKLPYGALPAPAAHVPDISTVGTPMASAFKATAAYREMQANRELREAEALAATPRTPAPSYTTSALRGTGTSDRV